MINAEQLSEEQKTKIRQWVADGDQLADLQKKLGEEFGENVTYMDTRFLALDLELEFKSEEPEAPVVEEPPVYEIPEDASLADYDESVGTLGGGAEALAPPPAGSPVQVTVDTVGRPGAMVSGSVTFADGERGSWMVDQAGRLSVDPDTPGYRPTEADLMSFQEALRKEMERM